MTPRQYRNMTRKLRRFWKEWGITKQDFNDIIACLSLFGMIYMLSVICIIVLK